MSASIKIAFGGVLACVGTGASVLAGNGPLSGIVGLMIGTVFGILALSVGLFLLASGFFQRLRGDDD